MANYSIVLNLSGNSVEQVERLATALERANVNAASLAASLRSVGAAATTVPTRTIRVGGMQAPTATTTTTATKPAASSQPQRTRHKMNQIASWGYGFSIGGFSARLSSILQPEWNADWKNEAGDAVGRYELFGLDAEALASRLNKISIVGNIGWAALKGAAKLSAYSTIGGYALGGGVTMGLTKLMMSDSMAEAAKLIQRRQQAELGLGEGYGRAVDLAEILAQDYGFERSTTLSSINTLAGLRLGGGNQRLTIDDAAGLTKVGGLIAQQSGVSFEKVMTNIQQLFAQAVPNIRDIRELIGQAPILGRYAIDEMEKRGIKGTDVRQFYKSTAELMMAFQRFEVENRPVPIAQQQGRVRLATQDMFVKLAQNENWWRVANNAIDIIGAVGESLNSLIASLTTNSDIRNSVNGLVNLIEALGRNSHWVVQLVGSVTTFLEKQFGVRIGEDNREEQTFKETALEFALDAYKPELKKWYTENVPQWAKQEVNDRMFESYFQDLKQKALLRGSKLLEQTTIPAGLVYQPAALDPFIEPGDYLNRAIERQNYVEMLGEQQNKVIQTSLNPNVITYIPPATYKLAAADALAKTEHDFGTYALAATVAKTDILSAFSSLFEKGRVTLQDTKIDTTTSDDDGSKVTGYNKDRRSLEIHFHAPIVEWNSEINTDSPQEVVNAVANNIEGAASRAIQIALLGASQKMSTRFY